MNRALIEAAIVLLALAAAGFGGWKVRDLVADRATASAVAGAQAAALKEADRQAGIHSDTENFLRDQLDRANAANAGVHLGAVRCSVSVREPSLAVDGVSAPDAATAGRDAAAALGDAAAGVGPDIGPALEHWAGGQLTAERERLRACQRYAAKVSAP